MQQRDPDRVTPTGMRDRTTGSSGLLAGLFVVGALVLGYMLFWPTPERTTNLTDSTRIERPVTPTTPPANMPQTDLKPNPTPPAKAPAQ